MRKGLLAFAVLLLSLVVTGVSSARYAPLEEQAVLPACLLAQTHPPIHVIPLCSFFAPR